MSNPITALGKHSVIEPLPATEAQALGSALRGSDDVSVFVDGTSYRLPASARAAVVDLLSRLAEGDGVELSSTRSWLTTSQAARLAGISPTYLRNLSESGAIPTTYRGTHRRFLSADILAWVAAREEAGHPAPDAAGPASSDG